MLFLLKKNIDISYIGCPIKIIKKMMGPWINS